MALAVPPCSSPCTPSLPPSFFSTHVTPLRLLLLPTTLPSHRSGCLARQHGASIASSTASIPPRLPTDSARRTAFCRLGANLTMLQSAVEHAASTRRSIANSPCQIPPLPSVLARRMPFCRLATNPTTVQSVPSRPTPHTHRCTRDSKRPHPSFGRILDDINQQHAIPARIHPPPSRRTPFCRLATIGA